VLISVGVFVTVIHVFACTGTSRLSVGWLWGSSNDICSLVFVPGLDSRNLQRSRSSHSLEPWSLCACMSKHIDDSCAYTCEHVYVQIYIYLDIYVCICALI
jgi:hypothetical protein